MKPEIRVAPPGPKAKALIEREHRHSSPSYIKEYPLVVERGEGSFIIDVDGNRYLDFMAGIAVTSTGHAHPKVVKAIQDQAAKFLHICGTDFYYESMTALQEKLSSYCKPMGPKKVFLSNSGTEAVEGAIKLARYHTKRHNIIAFKGAFHGRTTGAISLNASKVTQRAFFGPLMPGVYHVPYSNPTQCPCGVKKEESANSCDCVGKFLERDLFLSQVSPDEVAAIFVEPIQGEGGYILPSPKFLKDLRRICDQHKILLVFDEIQSGVGRTGAMYASEAFGVYPDIFVTAKGLGSGMPIGAIVAKESVMSWPRGSHGSTYGGNPVCSAAAVATLEIIEGLLPTVRATGEKMLSGLRALQAKHPIIYDMRGIGLMIGMEMRTKDGKPAADQMGKLEQLAFQKGLLLLGCGKSTIRFAPPLVITEAEVAMGLQILDECLKEIGN